MLLYNLLKRTLDVDANSLSPRRKIMGKFLVEKLRDNDNFIYQVDVPGQIGTLNQVGKKRSQKEAGPFKNFLGPHRNHVLKFSFSKSLREGFHPRLELVLLVLAFFLKNLRNKQFY